MILGTVIGSVVSTRKHETLVGNKLLIVQPLEVSDNAQGKIVAIDTLGAGIGEVVLVATGHNAKYASFHQNAPIDAAIVGIVDEGSQWKK